MAASIAPRVDGDNLADSIVDRFELHDAAAQSVHTAFAPPDTVQTTSNGKVPERT